MAPKKSQPAGGIVGGLVNTAKSAVETVQQTAQDVKYAVTGGGPDAAAEGAPLVAEPSLPEVPFTDDAAQVVTDMGESGATAATLGQSVFAGGGSTGDGAKRRKEFDLKAAIAAAIDQSRVRSLFAVRSALTAVAASKSKIPRFIIITMLLLQIVLLVVACIIAGTHRETIPENLRTFCIVLALFVTAGSLQPLAPVDKLKAKMRSTAALKCLSLVFEMQCFALATDWQSLFVVGGIIVFCTFVIFACCLWAGTAMSGYDPDDSEMLYTVFAAGHDDVTRLGEEIAPEVQARVDADGGEPTFEDLLAAARSAVGGQLKASAYTAADAERMSNAEEEELQRVIAANTQFVARNLDPYMVSGWFSANRIRQSIYSRDNSGVGVMIWLLLVLFVFSLGMVTYEFAKIFANQPPLFSQSLNEKYNALSSASFGTARSHSAWKVHVVVVDGLRDDLVDPGASSLGGPVRVAGVRGERDPAADAGAAAVVQRAELDDAAVGGAAGADGHHRQPAVERDVVRPRVPREREVRAARGADGDAVVARPDLLVGADAGRRRDDLGGLQACWDAGVRVGHVEPGGRGAAERGAERGGALARGVAVRGGGRDEPVRVLPDALQRRGQAGPRVRGVDRVEHARHVPRGDHEQDGGDPADHQRHRQPDGAGDHERPRAREARRARRRERRAAERAGGVLHEGAHARPRGSGRVPGVAGPAVRCVREHGLRSDDDGAAGGA
eukprot:CAMPEP_0174831748 /NCGR_PEP_ID=MMETSP1114-20130205/3276_1 /TAXON_ID=312471 /ORGANISM="Neobodo designis, Strain CCAP 1951/1" /LENGTH=725 /DNA_ID=CAMNT_0016065587 /DNA_START=215 /DNA_END=2388 /DNA_ORIENTATION=-